MDPSHHFSSFFTTTIAPTTVSPSPTNGLLPPNNVATTTTTTTINSNNSTDTGALAGPPIWYPHSVGPSSAAITTTPVEQPPRRKRGRPRKYGTPEQVLPAKKKAAAAASKSASYLESSKKSQQRLALGGFVPPFSAQWGNTGQGFTLHVISVSAGEDVGQKLMLFMQKSKREMCILSASGSISIASLRQPGMSVGNVTYEGQFEIISLSGSYVRTDLGGRTGGLSVCLSNTDGQIIGGGLRGPLKAAGPVEVIVGTFLLNNKKDANASLKGDNSVGKLPSPFGNPCTVQDHEMQVMPPQHDWRIGADAKTNIGYDLTGRTALGAHQSPESGDYEQFPE